MMRSSSKWEDHWKPIKNSVSIPDVLRYYTLNLLALMLLLMAFEWYYHFIQDLDGSDDGTAFKYWISFLIFMYIIMMILVYLPFPRIRKRELKEYYELTGGITGDFDRITEVVKSSFGEMDVDLEINVKHLYGFYFSRNQSIGPKDGQIVIRVYEGSKSAGCLLTNPLSILFLGHSHRKHHVYVCCDMMDPLNRAILKQITISLIDNPGEVKLRTGTATSNQEEIDRNTILSMIQGKNDDELLEVLDTVHGSGKVMVIRAFGKKKCMKAVDPLIHLLHHKNRMVRLASAIALGKIGDTSAKESLLKVSQSDGDPKVRKAARDAFDVLR